MQNIGIIYEFGDLKILRLDEDDLGRINKKELSVFPVIQVYGRHPFGVYHPENTTFYQRVNPDKDFLQNIRSKTEKKALLKNYRYIHDKGIKLSVKKATLEDYKKFEELYNKTTALKKRFLNISLKEQVFSKITGGMGAFFINATLNDKLLSSLFFYIRGTGESRKAAVTVRANKKIKELKSGLIGLIEVELVKFCIKNKVLEISHGNSTNPAGIVDSTGTFEFKTRYGNTPFPAGMFLTTYIKSREVSLSENIVFLTIGNDDLEYSIVCDEDKQEQYASRYLTKYVNKVRFVSWEDVETSYKAFIQKFV